MSLRSQPEERGLRGPVSASVEAKFLPPYAVCINNGMLCHDDNLSQDLHQTQVKTSSKMLEEKKKQSKHEEELDRSGAFKREGGS